MQRLLLMPLVLAACLAPVAAPADSRELAYAQASMLNSAIDGGMARALAYCVFHAPAFDRILANAAADGMSVSSLGGGILRILSPTDFPGALIQVAPLANGTASCMAWSTTAHASDADMAVDDAVGFYLKGGRVEKLAATPSEYVYRGLPFAARVRAFASLGGHGGIIEISGLAPQNAAMLRPVPPDESANSPPLSQPEAADQGKVYDFEFLLGTGCVSWLPDLQSAMTAIQRSSLPMSRNADSYYYVSDFGGLLQLAEGPRDRISECQVMHVIPLETANEIVRRTLATGNMSFVETENADGTARWTGILAGRLPGDRPIGFVAQTFFEPNQAEVTVRLKLNESDG